MGWGAVEQAGREKQSNSGAAACTASFAQMRLPELEVVCCSDLS